MLMLRWLDKRESDMHYAPGH
ncbi:hypothetical protein BQ8794_160027 [Mesorhizobium prunaredense]|uniref:Uncharacterized protein n=2 Tax=Mesorhizobium TaxID=68287 RepID=A0A1R3V3E2_9HYPH|nr:hypothetical protein BQ8794_160027 [Mesorhizobium prunaredense]SJM32885.1 hypothetical protein BQ8482_330020 [Mesorhizobium delmotii]